MRVLCGLTFGAWLFAACGPGLARQNTSPPPSASPPPPSVRPGVPPPSDEAGLRKLLSSEVVNGGLWFADASCQVQFGQSGTIIPTAFDAFAACLAGLHLRPTGREDSFDDTSVLTDDSGFEIEARVVKGRLDFIGFSGRGPGVPALPTITPMVLESLRVAGDPNATLSDDEASRVIASTDHNATHIERLRLCLGEDGQLNIVMPAGATTYESAPFIRRAVASSEQSRPIARSSDHVDPRGRESHRPQP